MSKIKFIRFGKWWQFIFFQWVFGKVPAGIYLTTKNRILNITRNPLFSVRNGYTKSLKINKYYITCKKLIKP